MADYFLWRETKSVSLRTWSFKTVQVTSTLGSAALFLLDQAANEKRRSFLGVIERVLTLLAHVKELIVDDTLPW
jgi:hypothetical protein